MADEKKTTAPAKGIIDQAFRVDGDPSKNYIIARPSKEIPRSEAMPFLMGRDGKLYVRKDLVNDGTKAFDVIIRERQ